MKITKEQLKQIIKEEFDQKAEINKLENRIVQAVLADRNDPMALQRLTKLSKMGKYNMNRIKKRVADAKREKKLTNELEQVIREELQAVIDEKKRKKKKKKAKKRDACYYKVKSRYDVWPSAYASGALVKCRRVGAKNWGKSTTKEELELYEGKESLEAKIRKVLIDEGGAAGMSALEKGTGAEQKQIKDAIKDMNDVGLHRDGDYILQDDEEINVKKK